MDVVVICFALSCLRGGALGHVLVLAIGIRSVLCLVVCAGRIFLFCSCCLLCLMGAVVMCSVL